MPVFRGMWDRTVDYKKLDIVYWNNCSWVAVSDNKNSEPTDENTANWLCVARGASFKDWSDQEKQDLSRIVIENLEQPINIAISNYIHNTLSTDATIQQWMSLISMSQSEYDALADKSGVHFVYPD